MFHKILNFISELFTNYLQYLKNKKKLSKIVLTFGKPTNQQQK